MTNAPQYRVTIGDASTDPRRARPYVLGTFDALTKAHEAIGILAVELARVDDRLEPPHIEFIEPAR